jgi:hypothetical protein
MLNQQQLHEAERVRKIGREQSDRAVTGFFGSWLGRLFFIVLFVSFAPALLMKLMRWVF